MFVGPTKTHGQMECTQGLQSAQRNYSRLYGARVLGRDWCHLEKMSLSVFFNLSAQKIPYSSLAVVAPTSHCKITTSRHSRNRKSRMDTPSPSAKPSPQYDHTVRLGSHTLLFAPKSRLFLAGSSSSTSETSSDRRPQHSHYQAQRPG